MLPMVEADHLDRAWPPPAPRFTCPRSAIEFMMDLTDQKETSVSICPSGVPMPFPRASQALSRFTVLDLTRVRSGPTCVRQLADWGANVIKIDALMEDAAGEQPGGPRHGSDFQNLHRNKRAMTLNLKESFVPLRGGLAHILHVELKLFRRNQHVD
jgi:hypothetical protein